LNRKINWRTKVYRQKSEDKFLHNIETQFGNKEDIVVCIGDWSAKQGSCIKGASTMGVGLKRLVRKRYTTLLLDEYNTSKKCCHCWKDIQQEKKTYRICSWVINYYHLTCVKKKVVYKLILLTSMSILDKMNSS
jgi:hypothetical protein